MTGSSVAIEILSIAILKSTNGETAADYPLSGGAGSGLFTGVSNTYCSNFMLPLDDPPAVNYVPSLRTIATAETLQASPSFEFGEHWGCYLTGVELKLFGSECVIISLDNSSACSSEIQALN